MTSFGSSHSTNLPAIMNGSNSCTNSSSSFSSWNSQNKSLNRKSQSYSSTQNSIAILISVSNFFLLSSSYCSIFDIVFFKSSALVSAWDCRRSLNCFVLSITYWIMSFTNSFNSPFRKFSLNDELSGSPAYPLTLPLYMLSARENTCIRSSSTCRLNSYMDCCHVKCTHVNTFF